MSDIIEYKRIVTVGTTTGYNLYFWFKDIRRQGFMSTDPDVRYSLPDNTMFSKPAEIEDWIIRMAEQIKSERQQIIMNNTLK